MAKIDNKFLAFGYMDTLARGKSPVHRLDPTAKIITTLIFICVVVSFGKYEISALLPLFIYPIALGAAADLPALFILKRILIVSPFAVMIGIFNPILDREILIHIGTMDISGGWVSYLSILIRFTLTVGGGLILIAITGFNNICTGLDRLGMPKPFTIQLQFLYRYIFVLADEAARLVRARSLRVFGSRGMGIRVFGSLAGQLLLRTLARAQRIHLAMCCRGFNGTVPVIRTFKIGYPEILFVIGWSILFFLMRFYNISIELGNIIETVLL